MDLGIFFGSVIELLRRALRAVAGFVSNHPLLSVLLLLLVICAVFMLAFSAAPYQAVPEASAFSDSYLGYSYFYALAGESHAVRAMYNFSSLAGLDRNDVLIIAGEQENYSPAEANQLTAFVRNGGSLVLFENAGQSSLAKSFGIGFMNGTVVDTGSFITREDFPVAIFTLHGAQGPVATKFPNALAFVPQSTIILETSPQSWVLSDGTSAIDDNDSGGPFPLGVETKYGNGTLLFVGDPNTVSNDLIWRENNSGFAQALLEQADSNGSLIVFDESHDGGTLSSEQKDSLGLLRSLSLPQTLMLVVPALLVLALALWWVLKGSRKPALKGRRYQALVQDISSQVLVRNEPYAWMVIVIYQRLRAVLLKHVNPFEREGITDQKLAATVARDVPSLDAAFLEKLLNQCAEIEKGRYVLNSFEESQMLCNNLMVCMKELGVEKWKPKML
jgi:hypothetical protein